MPWKRRAGRCGTPSSGPRRCRARLKRAPRRCRRERALFEPILGQEVGTAEVEEVKERVHELIEAHQWLSDRRDRAWEHVRRCQDQLKQARQDLRKCESEHEKIDTLMSDMRQIAEGAAMAREETEIEDLFSRPRRIGGVH